MLRLYKGGQKEEMYRKESEGWFKHTDFILIDMICLQVAFYLAYLIKGLGINPYNDLVYRNMAIVLVDLCQYFEHKKLKGYADFFNSSSSFCCGVI